MEPEEEFHNMFITFIQELRNLALPAEEQCENIGYINVAWELKEEIANGSYLINHPASLVSKEQKFVIEQLVNELSKIPESVLVAADTKIKNINAMSHPCWEPLRKHALIAIRALESVILSNENYFK